MALSQRYIKDTKFEDFDPNQPDKSAPVWAVYTGIQFKTHSQRAHAISSFRNQGQAKLYEFDNGRWELRATKRYYTAQPTQCDRCDGPTMDHPRRYDYTTKQTVVEYDRPQHNFGQYEWLRQGGKIADPLVLLFCCTVCRPIVRNA